VNRQNRDSAEQHVKFHYDIGHELYAAMLGRTMTYSCGYWRDATTLDSAQDDKHALICRKLGLRRGQRVLDIGCGWGEFLRYAAERFGVTGVGITLSPAQAASARQRCAGLPVEIHVQDYRDARGEFDRVVSVGMFEHVGPRNYPGFFDAVARLLTSDGLFLLHTIGGLRAVASTDRWIDRYIFPGAVLPSMTQVTRATEARFVIEDWHNLGADYDRTLMAWHSNFEAAWPTLQARYGDRFRRLWRYYLLTCAGAFRSRYNQLWQVVCSPAGVPGGYLRTA
jgi:cyclopropane-fatty-acyl-phospholipid synthase